MEISNGTGGKCFSRGVSIMRLALGYPEGLPAGFPKNGWMDDKKCVYWFARSFPDREVIVECSPSLRQRWPKNVTRVDMYFPKDEYLSGFVYRCDTDEGHFVIGDPEDHGVDEILMVLAVKI